MQALWVMRHGLVSEYNRWMIQIPRIFNIYRSLGLLDNLGQMMSNIFEPLFEVTLRPETDPLLARFLETVSGFDTVDDESKVGVEDPATSPEEWTSAENPSYRYYSYYIWANLMVLNRLRTSLGLNVFTFRPHCKQQTAARISGRQFLRGALLCTASTGCLLFTTSDLALLIHHCPGTCARHHAGGEAGPIGHLDVGFLLAGRISHGINLKKSPGLQYLYFLAQIGVALSPMSNDGLFLEYAKNPFAIFLRR
jgi:AMP deaminase